MSDSRYPFTYSCDLIRSFVGAHLPRAEASRIRSGIADEWVKEGGRLAKIAADAGYQFGKDISTETSVAMMSAMSDLLAHLRNHPAAVPEDPPIEEVEAIIACLGDDAAQLIAHVSQKAREAALEEWKPIETAPRDGGYFLTANFHNCFDPLGEYEVARYDPREFDDYEDAGGGLFRKVTKTLMEFTSDNFHRATHWAPIPRAIKDQHLPTEVKNG